jgi:hypothetical protein
VIDDISHVVANLFKHCYGQHPYFDSFIESCGKISKNIKQTLLSCLAPPEISIKARFMNLHRLVKWAAKIREHVLPSEMLKASATLRRLKGGIDQLPKCQEFIDDFLRDAQVMLNCQKTLKTRGLCPQTVSECHAFLQDIPQDSRMRITFTDWMAEHLALANDIGLKSCGLPVTTDQIESLFSLAKHHGVGEVKDANRIALHLPALAGTLTPLDAERVLSISVDDQRKIEGPLTSLTKQRRKVLNNPDNIMNLTKEGAQFLELIPGPKTGENCKVLPLISVDCSKDKGTSKIDIQNNGFTENQLKKPPSKYLT